MRNVNEELEKLRKLVVSTSDKLRDKYPMLGSDLALQCGIVIGLCGVPGGEPTIRRRRSSATEGSQPPVSHDMGGSV